MACERIGFSCAVGCQVRRLFSTATLPEADRFRLWRETVVERIVPVELSPIGDRPFHGSMDAADVGPLLITRIAQSAMRTEATPRTIRRHDKLDTLSVVIVLEGQVLSVQDDRQAVQGAGEIVVLDRKPTVMATQVHSRSLVLEIPRDRLERALGSVRMFNALTIGADLASTRLVTTFFDELIRAQPRFDADTAARMAAIGIDLLVAGIAGRMAQEVPKSLHGAVTLQRAKAYVETHLGDPTLDPPHLAAAMGISLRRLQQLFHQHDRSIADWIWKRRIEVAAHRLADPGFAHIAVGTLAHGCGFSSQSHFSRRFRHEYGMTPVEYRHGARVARFAVKPS